MHNILKSLTVFAATASLCISICAGGTTTLYSVDGRTLVKPDSEVELYKSLGWYTEPMTKMYSADGRTLVCKSANVEANKKVGWYTEPVTRLYSTDGRTIVCKTAEVETYKAVGWYTEPMTVMYSADGRTLICKKANVEANKKVGWYTEPVTLMYAYNGKSAYLPTANIESNLKVGWYLNRSDVYVTMYWSDGRTIECLKMNVEANKKVGWMTLGDYACKTADKYTAQGTTAGFMAAYDLLCEHMTALEKNANYESNADYIKISDKIKSVCIDWIGGDVMPYIYGFEKVDDDESTTVLTLRVYNRTDKTMNGFSVSVSVTDANGNKAGFVSTADASIVSIAPYKSAVYEIKLGAKYTVNSNLVYATGGSYTDGTKVGQ